MWKKSTKHFESIFKELSHEMREHRELTSVIMNNSFQKINLDLINNQNLNPIYDRFLESKELLLQYFCKPERILTVKLQKIKNWQFYIT